MLPSRLARFPQPLSGRRGSVPAIFVALVLIGLGGCAGTNYATEKAGIGASDTQGIRYYNDAPFVLVYSDGKGGLTSEVVWLPDTTRVRILRPYAWAAKNNSTYKFSNGVLTEAKAVVDETIVPAAVLSAAKDAVLAKFPSADQAGGSSQETMPPPALFRVVVENDGKVSLRGNYGTDEQGTVQDIHITVSQRKGAEDAK